MLSACDARRSSAVDHDLHFFHLLADELYSIYQRRTRDDRGPVLIIVKHRNLHRLLQSFFDVEAFRGLDVFEVDAAKRRLQQLAGLDDFVSVVSVELDVEHIDVCKAFEQHTLAFHHRLSGEGADVAETEHSGSVADYRYQVALGGVLVGIEWVPFDLETGHGNARRVGQAQVALRTARLAGNNFDLSRATPLVVVECFLLSDGHKRLQSSES